MRLKAWNLSILPTLILLLSPALSTAQVSVEVNVAPPELPVYDQPPIPGDGYVWTPGYWAWGDDIQDYYWVPGTWVPAPEPEYLWTPGYWAATGVAFFWHPGYWGPQVGFYGGVNYGYGYGGRGYDGGYWQGGRMYYNRSVNNISNTNITNVYNKTVINNVSVTRVSYNGGSGGVRAQPTSTELAAEHERHIAATPVQRQHIQAARSNPALRAAANHGVPPIAATSRPGAFSGAGVVHATRGGAVHAAPARAGGNAGGAGRGTMSVVHANPEPREAQAENRPENRPAPPPQARPPAPSTSRPPPPAQERQPAAEERRAPEQAQPAPRAAPAPRPQQPPPKAQPHPPEHPPAREEDREHH